MCKCRLCVYVSVCVYMCACRSMAMCIRRSRYRSMCICMCECSNHNALLTLCMFRPQRGLRREKHSKRRHEAHFLSVG